MRRRLPDFALAGATLVFGCTFLAVHNALLQIGPFELVAVRFLLGAITVAAMFPTRLKGLTRGEILGGCLIGTALFIGMNLQTSGLRLVDSSESGFITALYVPFVPALQVILFRKWPNRASWIGTALSLVGLVLLSGKKGAGFQFGLGEWMTLFSAVAFACQILLMGRFSPGSDSTRLTFVQLAVVGVLSLVCAPIVGETVPHWTTMLVLNLTCLGIVATGIGVLAINWGQKTVPATRATLLYAMEPVWAGIVGAIAGERFSPPAIVGCVLIVAGMLVGESD